MKQGMQKVKVVRRYSSRGYLWPILKGMILTFKKLLVSLFRRKKIITINYPEEKHQYSPRFRGTHILTKKKDGSLRCTACMLCATACPAQCIHIEAAESDDSSVEKYPARYEIDILRCIYCGYCEEACPVDAIRMGPEWQTPDTSNGNFIYDIKHLSDRPTLKGGIETVVDDQKRSEFGI